MKIAHFEIEEEEKKVFLQQNLAEQEHTFFLDPLNTTSLPEQKNFEVLTVFVNCQVNRPTLDAFPNLKLIVARSTGFDNIDLEYAKNKGIIVCNVPAYGSHTVAEYTFGLILALSRKINQAVNRVKIGFDFDFEGLRGFDLNGKTLGVVGTGKIGVNVIKIAKGFGMNILASDAYPNQELSQSLNFTYLPLEHLLQQADVVTLHVPYLPQTHHLIHKENIFLMKRGAYLVNTSRGAVVETEALFQALIQEHLGGAALDVLEEEVELKEEAELLSKNKIPTVKFKNVLENHILINQPNVLITPHMAFYTKEAEQSILQTTVDNIKGFLENTPENIVNVNALKTAPPPVLTTPAATPG
ncbi:MAG: hydroxyacid dehydrogenase [Armatimonadetes bacterium]|nr:MAG: hydroxyacid dehydrogenase [Armatimonadota bacterium]